MTENKPLKSEFYTPEQFALILGINVKTIRSKIKSGAIKALNWADPNRKRPIWKIPKTELEKFTK